MCARMFQLSYKEKGRQYKVFQDVSIQQDKILKYYNILLFLFQRMANQVFQKVFQVQSMIQIQMSQEHSMPLPYFSQVPFFYPKETFDLYAVRHDLPRILYIPSL